MDNRQSAAAPGPLRAAGGDAVASGLEGVVVAETRLSDVDGERGRLIIGGHDVEALAGRTTFEEACLLLWTGALPDAAAAESLRALLGAARVLAFDSAQRSGAPSIDSAQRSGAPSIDSAQRSGAPSIERLPSLGDALAARDGMDALRAAMGHLSLGGSPLPEQVLVTGAMAVYAAAWARGQAQGKPAPVPPDPSLGHAADYLRMVRGPEQPVDPALAAGLDAYLVTVSDHGMNASTFTARVVASTGSDLVSAVVAALGALKGPLHGGAPGPVLDMLDAIGRPDQAAQWLEAELMAGRRIMGMGHRVYRVRDPRAQVLERAIEALELAGTTTGRLQLARAVERAAVGVLRTRHPHRPLHANVEFYTAVLLDALGLPRSLFTPTFAVGRVAGWCAHVQEQRATGRLIRPASRYTGAMPA